jgi:putative DNA methylase
MLTWASIHLIGGGEKVQKEVTKAQKKAYEAADRQIKEWGIEHNEKKWRADAYLYCVEAICPATGLMLPLAPSWVISEKYKVCAVLNRAIIPTNQLENVDGPTGIICLIHGSYYSMALYWIN